MPRKPGIYRKIKQCRVDAMCVKLNDGTTYTEEFTTPMFKDKNAILKYLQKEYNNSKHIVVKVKKVVEVEKIFFLSIDKFLKYAIESEVK